MLFSEPALLIQHGGQLTLFCRRANGRKSSTIYDLDKAAIESFGTILIITLSGIEDIFAQTLHTRIFMQQNTFFSIDALPTFLLSIKIAAG